MTVCMSLTDRLLEAFRALFLGIPRAELLRFADFGSAVTSGTAAVVPTTFLTVPRDSAFSGARTAVDVSLPVAHLLVRTLDIPKAPPKKLRQMLELDLIRRTPFKPADIHFAYAAKPDAGQLAITQWVAKCADIASYRRNLNTHGYAVRRFVVEDGSTMHLLSDHTVEIAPHRRMWRVVNGIAVASAALAILTIWLWPAVQAQNNLATDATTLAQLRDRALALKADVDLQRTQAAERGRFVDTVMVRSRLVDTLRILTVSLPDTMWVSELNLQGQIVALTCEIAGSAADLVLELSASHPEWTPSLTGPVSRVSDGKERFTLTVQLQGGSR